MKREKQSLSFCFNWDLKLSVKAVNIIAFGTISVSEEIYSGRVYIFLLWRSNFIAPCYEDAEENQECGEIPHFFCFKAFWFSRSKLHSKDMWLLNYQEPL